MKNLLVFLFCFVTITAYSQNSITYEYDHHNAEESRLIFYDKNNQEIISLSPTEKNPYWNLKFPEIKDTNSNNKTYKLYDLKSIDSLDRDEIPGLVSFTGDQRIVINPEGASTGQTCILSSNSECACILSSIYFYQYEDCIGRAMNIQVYNSSGEFYRQIYPTEGEIAALGITDNGKFLLYSILIENFEHARSYYRTCIIDLESLHIIFEINDNEIGKKSILCGSYGNFLYTIYENLKNKNSTTTNSSGYIMCFDMSRMLKYEGNIADNLLDNLKSISDAGIIFGKTFKDDTNTVLISFKVLNKTSFND